LLVRSLNGAVRVTWLTPAFGDSAAHVLGALSLSAVVVVVAWLAIAFEFLAGSYLFGSSWQALLAQYDVSQGQLWELVLVTMLIAPVAAALAHHLIGRHRIISSTQQARFRP
jgi:hypothetical protein